MPPKISLDAKLAELHAFILAYVLLLSSRSGESVQGRLRQLYSKEEKYWHRFLSKHVFNDPQQQRFDDMYTCVFHARPSPGSIATAMAVRLVTTRNTTMLKNAS